MGNGHHELIWFSGHVQGVGFRYSTLQVAKEFEVSGFVQNLNDGRVLVEAEGQKPEIDRFVKAVEDRMHGHVRKIERRSADGVGEFSGFIIRLFSGLATLLVRTCCVAFSKPHFLSRLSFRLARLTSSLARSPASSDHDPAE